MCNEIVLDSALSREKIRGQIFANFFLLSLILLGNFEDPKNLSFKIRDVRKHFVDLIGGVLMFDQI